MRIFSVGRRNKTGAGERNAPAARFFSSTFGPEGRSFSRPLAPGPRPRSSGVTLLEMLVVTALIGAMAALSYPSVSSGLDSVRIASSSDDVATFLNSAVNRAERRQVPVEVVIAPKENRLTMTSTEPGFQRVLQLPDGILLEAVLPAIENEQPGEPRRLMLMPGSTVPGVGIQLANRHGAHRLIHLDPMTGFPRVENVVSK